MFMGPFLCIFPQLSHPWALGEGRRRTDDDGGKSSFTEALLPHSNALPSGGPPAPT